MKTDAITIANLSCGGCVNTITKNLAAISGVEKVEVDLATNIVAVAHTDAVSVEELIEKLTSLGYPEATAKNGLITHLKSITSCMTGKLTA
jgi:copper chaperone